MSSSKESMSKGEEKKESSKIYPKDEMPKVPIESNSKGARPKTSSTSLKSKKETHVEKKLNVVIMNAHGDHQGKGTANRRKSTILNVIKRLKPDLVLYQEFKWRKIYGKIWSHDPVLKLYKLTGNEDAKIMYNINELIVTESYDIQLQRILQKLQGPTSKHPTPIPLKFAPISRMCLRVVKTKGVPVMEFICISWHGKHTGINTDTKITEFKYLMIFLKNIYEESDLPILIAGDFNVDVKLICDEVKDPFKLYEYKASERRKKKRMIDYFIASTELHLSDLTPVDLKKDSDADKPEEVMDHDPIMGKLEPATWSDTVPALNKATAKISKNAK